MATVKGCDANNTPGTWCDVSSRNNDVPKSEVPQNCETPTEAASTNAEQTSPPLAAGKITESSPTLPHMTFKKQNGITGTPIWDRAVGISGLT